MDKKSRELVMGKLYMKNRDFKMAEKSFSEYLNSNPEDFQALKMLAAVYENLNDISKAFDLYEQCYLVEPDKKGVLLDICRLLLMNDLHVDPRKWLKPAIKAFPSNPIVIKLRDTLPIEDYEPAPSKATVANEVVLAKLDSLEQRLIAIEKILTNMTSGSGEKKEDTELPIKHFRDMQPFKVPDVKPVSKTSGNLFGSSPPTLKFEPKGSDFSNFMQKPATTAFGASSDSGNLFADSLKKFNLPAEGSWTISKKDEERSDPKKDIDERREDEGGEDGDNEIVENPELPIENFCEMQPIQMKSGEEDEDIIFEQRCKLFRFRDKEYKERGLGNIKVLKHRSTGAGRLIMRRELINLVCLNCWSCSKIERVRDTQVRFAGLDASDEEPEMTVFLAKFKTQELTDQFMNLITDLFPEQ